MIQWGDTGDVIHISNQATSNTDADGDTLTVNAVRVGHRRLRYIGYVGQLTIGTDTDTYT